MKTLVGQPARFLSAGIVLASLMLLPVTGAWSQQKTSDANQKIVGTWKLVSNVNTGKDGVAKDAYGSNPHGEIIFTSNGQYMNFNSRSDIPKFTSGNRLQGTAEENKAVVHGSIAHFGTYSVSPDGKVVTMNIVGSTWPSWVGAQEKRNFTIAGDELKYTIAATTMGGTGVIIYKRMN